MTENIKVICCDIDGTLVRDDKSLPEENCYWISKAVKEKGILFTIVSGRMYSAVSHFYQEIGVSGISACLNGTSLVDEKGKVLINHTIPKDISRYVVELRNKYKVDDFLCVSKNTWHTERLDSYIHKVKLPIYQKECILTDFNKEIDNIDVNKFLFITKDQTILKGLQEDLKDCTSLYPGSNFLEIMPRNINKGTSIDDIVAYFGLSYDNVMAIGDDVNDIEMLQKAGLGVAMGNAFDCAKEASDVITDTNQNGGVSKAIQKYIFGLEV